MAEIITTTEDIIAHTQRVLSPEGRLSIAIPGFVARTAQIDLAKTIAETLIEQGILVAEAGTGTGKTFAYLIPCLLNGKKTIISTATKTLQDQLFQKDLPLLIRALGLALRVQNLKGRNNYICHYRLRLHAQEGRFIRQQDVHEILHINEKLAQLTAGERSELPEISEDSTVWPFVTSTADNCLGNECAYYQDCFLVKARKRALEADLIVINHHLFFADSQLKDEGFGELLPKVSAIIFDEAHQIAEIAAHFNGKRVSTRQFRELMDDVLREWPLLDLANQPLKKLSLDLDEGLAQLQLAVTSSNDRIAWKEISYNKNFIQHWQALLQLIDELLACITEAKIEDKPGLTRCLERLKELKLDLVMFNQADNDKVYIRWIERFKQSLVFQATPFNIVDAFNNLLAKQQCAYIFTSATLTMNASFDCFTKPLGLERAKTLFLPSPFNFQQQVLLYLPRALPDPNALNYYECLLSKALPIINACGGRCFFLFTSHRALKIVAEKLLPIINYPLLIQGDEAKPILLARFRQLQNAVLLGTSTFWEGVDVKGEALSCVIIDKLPFTSPLDPVTNGKMAYLKAQGLSGFDELTLPNAVLALKQGVGRLIRDANDRGVLMIADPRLTARNYGRHIFNSLPSMPKTRDEKRVLMFIDTLVFENESTSN